MAKSVSLFRRAALCFRGLVFLLVCCTAELAFAGECNDGADNDGDGLVDALTTLPHNAQTLSIYDGSPFNLLNAATFKAIAFRDSGLVSLEGHALRRDYYTAQKVCNYFGYRDVADMYCSSPQYGGRCNFTSPGNNYLYYWNGYGWLKTSAAGKEWLANIRCRNKMPACDDRLDNDRDGKIDLYDPGCSSQFDNSEQEHDPGCTSPLDSSERGNADCDDGKDNDKDGFIDLKDPGCSGPTDGSENGPAYECDDGKDNDKDGRIDLDDPGCKNAKDDSEDGEQECQDGKDNDKDGFTDYPADPGCVSATDSSEKGPAYACDDGKDNDGDGRIDLTDPGCKNAKDDSEDGEPECQDKKDNDKDGFTDFPADPGCVSETDSSEKGPAYQCDDGKDNDGDGRIDLADPGCSGPKDNSEAGEPECQDKKDNDGDGLTDFPADPGCTSTTDPSEKGDAYQCDDGKDNDSDGKIDLADPDCSGPKDDTEAGTAECQDGKDNDADGLTDFPADPGCTSATDTSEKGDAYQCDDGKDNDSDGKIDLADPDCSGPKDNTEGSDAECHDKKDNDGDGLTDFPADPGCTSATDTSEKGDAYQCDDGKDNDSDGKIDLADPDCSGPKDDTEGSDAECRDKKDNDSDGLTDFPADPGCTSATDTSEKGDAYQCDDGKDNDHDGAVDLADPDCTGPSDDSEDSVPQCKDGKDNDGDGKIDLADPGCSSPKDNDERDESQCQDGKDNDGDGKIDLADPGCSSETDDNEGDETTQCADGKDNDGDGWIDYPEDTGCSSATDDDESNSSNPVTPTVNCLLDNGDGTSTAFFGYVNSSGQSISIAAGANDRKNLNTLSPGDAVRGQTSLFLPGTVVNAFSVVFPAHKDLTWMLAYDGSDKNMVVAKPGVSKACLPVEPIVECVDRKRPGRYTARFGYDNQNGFDVPMLVGQYNLFVPSPGDRGQPDHFFRGLVKNAFSVDFECDELTWKLGVKAVTASVQFSPPCKSWYKAAACSPEDPSCGECSSVDRSESLQAMVQNLRDQQEVAQEALERLKAVRSEGIDEGILAEKSARVDELGRRGQTFVEALPLETVTCTIAPQGCTDSDNTPHISGYRRISASLNVLTGQILRELKKASGGKLAVADKKLGVASDKFREQAHTLLTAVPRFGIVCTATEG